jgi:hypothetical protein
MTDREILLGNQLIATFVGDKTTPDGLPANWYEPSRRSDALKYNKSWDWLMPIVEYLEEKCDAVIEIHRTRTKIISSGYMHGNISDSRIEASFQAIVNFVKWYKSHKEPE